MAKKNFTDSLIGNNRSKKLDMLVSKPAAEVKAEPAPTATPARKQATKKSNESKAVETPKSVTSAKEVAAPATKEATPKKRGRKKKDIERDSFFYTVEKEFLFQIKAAAFWDRRDISEFISRAIKYYMDQEMGESEMRRAVREFKSRLEEQK
ncbi:MAG: hypothetical protein HRU41_29970 [Saprospiraceae bacterium]|nr:hypothetical protein [Saprospiraceae bacterium]